MKTIWNNYTARELDTLIEKCKQELEIAERDYVDKRTFMMRLRAKIDSLSAHRASLDNS